MSKENQPQESSLNPQQVVELQLEFFGKKFHLRCPIENQEKLTLAAKKLAEKFEVASQGKMDAYQVVLMTCLKYAFHEEVKKEIVQSTIEELKQIKKTLVGQNSSINIQQPNELKSVGDDVPQENDSTIKNQQPEGVEEKPAQETPLDQADNIPESANYNPPYHSNHNIDEGKYGRIIPVTATPYKS